MNQEKRTKRNQRETQGVLKIISTMILGVYVAIKVQTLSAIRLEFFRLQ